MHIVLALAFLGIIFYFLIQFARQEHVQEYYEDIIIDVEGRLDWARTRTFFPFGMEAQLEVSYELLGKAKTLWKEKKWHQAYSVARQSQEAMNRAQNVYSSAIKARQEDEKRQAAQADKANSTADVSNQEGTK